MRRWNRYVLPLGLALLVGLGGGCATIDLPDKIDLKQTDKPEVPVRMTALWTDTVLVEAGVVGFGGRIMFYGRKGDDPIRVDGELTVFAYDDTGDVRENTVPAKKYVFRPEELDGHYSLSKLGHSYSFWIPWDRVGGPRRQISLIARFKSNQGGVAMSEMTRHMLPGSEVASSPQSDDKQALPSEAKSAVTQAAHQVLAPTHPAAAAAGGLQTTTIALSEALREAAARSEAKAVPSASETTSEAEAPGTAPAVLPTRPAAATTPTEPAEIREMVREAVQQALAESRDEQPVDRFGRRKYRARISPKLPPTRDPAPSSLHPGAQPSGPTSTLQRVPPTGSATATSVSLAPQQP